jgi:thiol-disulfide isomerase/thioredoxin
MSAAWHPDGRRASKRFQSSGFSGGSRATLNNPGGRTPGFEGVGTRQPAVDVSYRTLDGERRQLSSSSKGRVVFLDLWHTWCVQCVAEMPTVQRLRDHYRDDPSVSFLIVSPMDSAQRFTRTHTAIILTCRSFSQKTRTYLHQCSSINFPQHSFTRRMDLSWRNTLGLPIGLMKRCTNSSMG